jgi:hypothetical protein
VTMDGCSDCRERIAWGRRVGGWGGVWVCVGVGVWVCVCVCVGVGGERRGRGGSRAKMGGCMDCRGNGILGEKGGRIDGVCV